VTRYTTEIVADQMQMLGSGRDGGSASYDGDMGQGAGPDDYNQAPPRASAPAQAPASKPAGGGNFDDFDDDIPF